MPEALQLCAAMTPRLHLSGHSQRSLISLPPFHDGVFPCEVTDEGEESKRRDPVDDECGRIADLLDEFTRIHSSDAERDESDEKSNLESPAKSLHNKPCSAVTACHVFQVLDVESQKGDRGLAALRTLHGRTSN